MYKVIDNIADETIKFKNRFEAEEEAERRIAIHNLKNIQIVYSNNNIIIKRK